MKLSVCALLFVLVLSSCGGTYQISYPVGSSKSAISLPENNARLVVLNRVQLDYSVERQDGYFSPSTPLGMNAALAGFRDEISARRFFSNAGTFSDFKEKSYDDYPEELSLEELKGIAGDADLVAVLAAYDQYYRDDYKVEIRREDLGGKIYKEVDYFIGVRTLYLFTGWRLYDSRTGKLLDEFTTNEEYTYESESQERLRATQLLEQNFNKELDRYARMNGREFASRISPTNHYSYRSIYTKGNEWLDKGNLAVRQENWDDAVATWKKGLKRESNRKKLAKLYHNLAIASEKSGDIAQAKEHAKLAANMHPIGRQTQAIIGY